MVKDLRKLRQLQALAHLRQEVELAKFARLSQTDQEIATRQAALRRAESAALRVAPQSSTEARLQERFRDWSDRRLDLLQGEREALKPVIDAQREIAAGALGRDSVLEQLAEQLAQAAQRDRLKRN